VIPDIITELRAQAATPNRFWMRRSDGREVSYDALWQETGRYANALAKIGVSAGDRVLLQAEKVEEVLSVYLACLRLGAVFLPINPAYTVRETLHFLTDAAPRLAIVDGPRRDELMAAGVDGGMTLPLQAGPGSLAAMAAASPAEFVGPAHDPDDLAAILYTSGTTGRSKGVMLTRLNLASNARVLVDLWQFTPADVLLHALPVFHTHGLFVATNCVICSGASMIFQRGFVAADALGALPQATVMMGVPTFYTRLLAEKGLGPSVTRGIRLFISGSAPLSPSTHQEWEARTGHRILERYGMTETNMITSNPYIGDRRAGTVGQPLPGVSVRVVHVGTGGALPVGEPGSIEVKGPNVFKGYWQMPAETAREFRADGYFVTGDLGAFDSDGYLSILGRAKDLVISGGLNIYPAEVEAALDHQPGVATSAVIGVPHPDFGEAVVACIVPAPGSAASEADLRLALRAELAAFKIPKRIVILPDLPRNAMGKVQKATLRKTYDGLFKAP
jgi:malonyl-CoA/methylmalonyl-CoA synthetase